MKSPLQNNAHKQKFNPNYYPSVASVDSSSIESTCIFPETLNKMHNCMCDRKTKTVNQQICNLTLPLGYIHQKQC